MCAATQGPARVAGGIIGIGGPPLGGKGLLAARLAECLPDAVEIAAIDDLRRAHPVWFPDGTAGPEARCTTAALLERAQRIWSARPPGRPPVLIVVARFAAAGERSRAKAVARASGMRFLFIEARSRDERALRRLRASDLPPAALRIRLERYASAVRAYQPLSRVETVLLPGLRLARVLADLEQSVDRVLALWRAG
jgi:hypothetical protein